ncbi:CD81 [Branchiostoma lanceolatum]|uniref:Tetraspanin n=1 Tax=Branchiostoma lanceolatum TaxID=7740 RepID=A0A8K0EM14_BRALA|nr:CD81 [Branchiostoma lanceolatum]
MAVEGCMRCLKYLMFIFNFLFWLLGCAILGVAIWLRVDQRTTQYVDTGENLSSYYIGTYVLMAVGGIMMLVGFLGCCGAIYESQCMLCTFFIFLLLIFAAEIGGGIWAFLHQDDLTEFIKSDFEDIVKSKYGVDQHASKSWDGVQESLMCCGAADKSDWAQSSWGNQQKNWGSVPQSCCETPLLGCGSGGIVLIQQIHQKGCTDKLIEFFHKNLMIIGCVGIAIGVIQLLGMTFALCLCCSIRRNRNKHYHA